MSVCDSMNTLYLLVEYLGKVIMRGRCVSGHVARTFVSDTSPKCIDREGLERRRTGTRQEETETVHRAVTPYPHVFKY